MRTLYNSWAKISLLSIALGVFTTLQAQTYSLKNSESKMEVAVTSNLHDWELDVDEMSGTMQIITNDGKLESVPSLDFNIVAESLLSGKRSMDKNTFKALRTDTYKTISYELQSVTGIQQSGEYYKVNARGKLRISGVTKTVSIPFMAELKNDAVNLSGSYKLLMTDYKIDPPTALFGTITTGDELIINFKTTFINSTL